MSAWKAIVRGLAAGGALALVNGAPALAGDWKARATLSVDETYSDNIGLARSGLERHDFVTSVRPGVTLNGTGGRVSASLAYNLQAVRYARDSRSDQLNHTLQASSRARLYEQTVFLDTRATAGQRNSDPAGVLAEDNLTASNNRRQFYTYSVAPVVRHRFGRYANAEARSGIDRVINEDGPDTTSRHASGTVSSGRAFGRTHLALSYGQRKNDNSGGSSSTFRNVNARLSYQVTRTLRPFASVGRDFNDFRSNSGDTDGITWRTGATWTPSPRTTLEGSYGRQFFGSSVAFNVRHRTRRTALNAGYSERATTTSVLQLEELTVPLVVDGEPIIDPATGQPAAAQVLVGRVVDETIINRRFNGGLTVRGRRTTGSVQVFDDRRSFEVSGGEDETIGVNVVVSRRLSRNSQAGFNASWQQSTIARSAREDERVSMGVNYSRTLYRGASGRVGLSHLRNASNVANREFSETRVTAGVNVIF